MAATTRVPTASPINARPWLTGCSGGFSMCSAVRMQNSRRHPSIAARLPWSLARAKAPHRAALLRIRRHGLEWLGLERGVW